MMIFYASSIAIPFISAALVPLVSRFGSKARDVFAVTAGFLTAFMTVALLPHIRHGSAFGLEWLPSVATIGVNLDALSVNMAVIAGVLGALIVLYSTRYIEEEGAMRYYALTLLFIGAMIGMVLSDNFLTLYIFWEIMGLCSYALIGFFYKDPKAVAAGMKAFITTRVGDVGLLIGIIMLYLATGTFNINETLKFIPNIDRSVLSLAGFLFMLGAIGKSAQVPLHVWLPDAMEAPTSTSALIHAATMVNAGVYLMARTFPLFSGVAGWMIVLTWVGVITAFIAASMALVEKDLKRVLAFSTVSQLGFMMFSIGVGGLFASQYHLMSHAIFKALLFLSAGSIIHAVHTRNMYEMGGLFKDMKITTMCFAAGALALMGVPIFNGFFSKDMIFEAALHSGNYVPLVLAVITAVMTVIYALRAFFLVFLGKPKHHGHDAPWQMTLPLVILAIGAATSWMFGPQLSNSLHNSGLHVEGFTLSELIREMMASPTLIISLFILATGIVTYIFRGTIKDKAKIVIEPFMSAAAKGFWFDEVYNKAISALFSAGGQVRDRFDEGIINRANYNVGGLFSGFSQAFRITHTGQLNLNVIGIILGLAFVLVIIMWR